MMENGSPQDTAGKMEELMTSLQHLLEEQLAAGREGNFAHMLQWGELASAIVARIVEQGGDASAIVEARRHELKRLYDELALMVQAEQSDTRSKLKQLRQTKRAAGAYRMDR
jgi:hypothetical protein